MEHRNTARINPVSPVLLIAALVAACASDGSGDGEPGILDGAIPETLEAWGLFLDAPAQVPADDVIPYDVIAPLYSDGALKLRYMRIPDGAQIGYSETEPWAFPDGTVLVKTFGQARDEREPGGDLQLFETRLLVRGESGWTPLTYVWNEDQDEARLVKTGRLIDVAWLDRDGEPRTRRHVVPNQNECRDCHGTEEHLDTLGGRTRMLNRDNGPGSDNQIDMLDELGLLDRPPAPAGERQTLTDPSGDGPLTERARAYMDSNCGTCHQPGRGEASQSGFFLDYAHTDPQTQPEANWGVCKTPTSAGGATCGLTHDVVPGDPDRSILICRMETDRPKAMMPPLGRTLVDEDGVALLRAWIEDLPPGGCE